MKFETIFENEYFVAISKPSGLLSVPDRKQSEPSLKDLLKEKYGEIFTVHRLDKNTSGLIIYAKDALTHKTLSKLFEEREVTKIYLGLVHGTFHPENGVVDIPMMEHPAKNGTMTTNAKGKPSKSAYETLEKFKNYSFVQFQIFTGRTHQIRVHTKYLGQFIVCDELYGDGKPLLLSSFKKKFNLSKDEFDERPIMPRLALHSSQICFNLYDQVYNLEAPLPKDFMATLKQLRKHSAIQKSPVAL